MGVWKISVKLSQIELDSIHVKIQKDVHETIEFSIPMNGIISGSLVFVTDTTPLDVNGTISLGLVSNSWQIPSRIFTGKILDGKFRVSRMPPGHYIVMNSIPEYALLSENNPMVTVEPNQHVTDVVIPLEKGALVHGRLVDVNAVPIPNIVVRPVSMRVAPRTYSPAKYLRRVRTDANGEFLTMVPSSTDRTHTFYIILDNPGFQGKRVGNDIAPNKTFYEIGDIELEKTIELKGHISRNMGKGNLEVVLYRHGKSPAPIPIHVPEQERTFVDLNRNFSISGLYPIPYTLTVLDNGKVIYLLDLINPQELTSIKITQQKTQIIQGRVTDIEGIPLIGVNVTATMNIIEAGMPTIILSTCISQADGIFQLELLKVKDENLRLHFSQKGYIPKVYRKSGNRSNRDLKIVLEKTVSLVGQVMIIPELSQEGDFTIKLFPIGMSMQPGTSREFDDREPLFSRQFKRAKGSFSIEGLSNITYRLYVVGEGLEPTNIRVDLTEGDKEVNIFVKSSIANLSGRLLWADSKRPVKNVLIRRSWFPWELEPNSMLGDFTRFEVSTNEQGIFTFQNIFEGKRYVLAARCVKSKTDEVDSEKRVIWKKIEVVASKDADYVIYVGTKD